MENAFENQSPSERKTSIVVRPKQRSWLDRELYPFALGRFDTPHGTMSYVDEGTGPVILFVHGTPSWSFEWRAVIAALSATHRCVAPDHLGFGLSDKPANAPLSPSDHAERLRALVCALDLRDVTLVVHDFGGPIGLPLALEMPDRIARVVVLNTWMWSTADEPSAAKLHRVICGIVGRILYRWLNASPRLLLPATFADRKRLTKRIHRQYITPFGRRAEREGPYALARALFGAADYYASLWRRRHELSADMLTVVWGERDPALTTHHLQRWVDAYPGARVVRVADAGHSVAEERPDILIDVLRGG